MNITIATVGTRGDVQPYIALGSGLKSIGHQVNIATDPLFREFIETSDLGFAPVAADPRIALQEDISRIGSNPIRLLRWTDRQFTPLARQYFIDMRVACQDSDAVLVSALAFAAMHVAQSLGIPSLATYLYPITPTREFPSMSASKVPGWLAKVGLFNWLSFRLYNLIFFRMMLPLNNKLRGEILGLPPVPWTYYQHIDISEVPIVYGYSRHVIQIPKDWGDHLHVTGYWFFDKSAWEPPPDLVNFIENGPAPIYIGFGSMVDAEAVKTMQIVLEALEFTGQRAILYGGWSNFRSSGLSEYIYKVSDIPHQWLLPRMATIVHHGGAGTTAAACRAGVPSVIVPYFADQPFWARHVHQQGASPPPIPRAELDSNTLADRLQEAVNEKSIHHNALSLGKKISNENGVTQAACLIDSYLKVPAGLMRFNP